MNLQEKTGFGDLKKQPKGVETSTSTCCAGGTRDFLSPSKPKETTIIVQKNTPSINFIELSKEFERAA